MRLASRDGGLPARTSPVQVPAAMGSRDWSRRSGRCRTRRTARTSAPGSDSGRCCTALRLCRLHEDGCRHSMSSSVIARPRSGIELVAVGALEHDALAVERHDAVLDGHMPEADARRGAVSSTCAVRAVAASRIERRTGSARSALHGADVRRSTASVRAAFRLPAVRGGAAMTMVPFWSRTVSQTAVNAAFAAPSDRHMPARGEPLACAEIPVGVGIRSRFSSRVRGRRASR